MNGWLMQADDNAKTELRMRSQQDLNLNAFDTTIQRLRCLGSSSPTDRE